MSNPSVSFNQKQTDPSLADLLKIHKRDIMLSLNCHALATIQSFDSSALTVTATINYKKSLLTAGADGVYKTTLVDYPLMLDMPLVIIGGGPANITFPIQQGDTCLILFNDRDIDNWFQSGQVGPVASGRLHAFSDGVALVGVRSQANPIDDYDETRAGISWMQTVVKVSEDKVKIANAVESLNAILQDLMTQLEILTVVCAAPGNPSSVPANAAAFTAIATRLGALLE